MKSKCLLFRRRELDVWLRLKTIKGNVQRRWSGLLLGGSIRPNYLSCISRRCVHIICIRAAATGCRIVKRNGEEAGYRSVLLLIFLLPLCRLLSHSRQLRRFRFLASRSLFFVISLSHFGNVLACNDDNGDSFDAVCRALWTRCMIGVSTDKMGSVGRLRTAIIMKSISSIDRGAAGGGGGELQFFNCDSVLATVTLYSIWYLHWLIGGPHKPRGVFLCSPTLFLCSPTNMRHNPPRLLRRFLIKIDVTQLKDGPSVV